MSATYTLPLNETGATIEQVGGKGASLTRLIAAGLPVPGGFHVTTQAYRQFTAENDLQLAIQAALEQIDPVRPSSLELAAQAIQDRFMAARIPAGIATAIVEAYSSLPGRDPEVAVRSSATAEDLPTASFAGQQETFLNVCGASDLLEAVKKCWASLWTARAIDYRARQGISPDTVALAVVVQLMLPAEVSGILFTANPLNGRRDQLLINAAWGLGESIVGGLVNPDTFVVDRSQWQVIDQSIAEKQVMTVRVNGGTHQEPVPEELRRIPSLSEQSAASLSRLGVEIEGLYETPMDIEWVLADGMFSIVQARPITALPEPVAEPPTEWPMPDPKGQYMRASIIDFLPNPLSPLFATLGMPEFGASMQRLLDRLVNTPEALPDNVFFVINGYAYMQASYTPRQWWLLLSRLGVAMPRMLRTQVGYWQEVALPQYRAVAEIWNQKDLQELSAEELLHGVKEIMRFATDHLATMQAGTLGVAAGTEMLFTRVYDRLIKRPGDPPAPVFLLGFDSKPIQAEKYLYDLAEWSREHPALSAYLVDAPAEEILARFEGSDGPPEVDDGDWQTWTARFHAYLHEYGYAIFDLDFAYPLLIDDPAPALEAVRMYVRGEGKDPYQRQEAQAARRAEVEQDVLNRVGRLKRWAFKKTLAWAQRHGRLREDSIAEIGAGYPAVRRLLAELGRRYTEAGIIAAAGDIYWLEVDEVEASARALDQGFTVESKMVLVERRKAEWNARKGVSPPPQLPPNSKYLGMDFEQYTSGGAGSVEGNTLRGVGASPGRVTATARVLHGPEDFDQMGSGDVLVASITTPAWTPLFAMASAIVTDVGGPLSHGSIVAREYGIPAVLGTGSATRLIRSGQSVTVDGANGTVTIEEAAA